VKATVKILIERGLDCRPRTAYVAVIDGGKSEKVSTPTPSGKAE
jgi:hypothetical protein